MFLSITEVNWEVNKSLGLLKNGVVMGGLIVFYFLD